VEKVADFEAMRFDEVGQQRNDARREAVLCHDAHLELRDADHFVAVSAVPRPRRNVQQALLHHQHQSLAVFTQVVLYNDAII